MIDENHSEIEVNKKKIKKLEDWLLPRANYGDDDPETFINNIYEERMESQSYEEKSRSILERDQLLNELRERKGEDGGE